LDRPAEIYLQRRDREQQRAVEGRLAAELSLEQKKEEYRGQQGRGDGDDASPTLAQAADVPELAVQVHVQRQLGGGEAVLRAFPVDARAPEGARLARVVARDGGGVDLAVMVVVQQRRARPDEMDQDGEARDGGEQQAAAGQARHSFSA
jgi:hypothetical protein